MDERNTNKLQIKLNSAIGITDEMKYKEFVNNHSTIV